MVQQLTSPTDMRRINRQALLKVLWAKRFLLRQNWWRDRASPEQLSMRPAMS